MAKKTIREQIIAALEARGLKPITNARTTKYIVFQHPNLDGRFLYVGAGGALRTGKTIADSIPADRFKQQLLAEAPS